MRLLVKLRKVPSRTGFSMVEAIVSISIIAVLFALLLPAIQRVREASNQLACKFRLKQLALSIHHFERDFGCLPPRNLAYSPPPNRFAFAGVGWLAQVLPYLENNSVWVGIPDALNQAWEGYRNPPHIMNSELIQHFACPTDSRMPGNWQDLNGYRLSYTSYIGVMGYTGDKPSAN